MWCLLLTSEHTVVWALWAALCQTIWKSFGSAVARTVWLGSGVVTSYACHICHADNVTGEAGRQIESIILLCMKSYDETPVSNWKLPWRLESNRHGMELAYKGCAVWGQILLLCCSSMTCLQHNSDYLHGCHCCLHTGRWTCFRSCLIVCAVCVYMNVNAIHTREGQRRMAVSLTQSHSHPPVRQAGLQAPESHLSQTACWDYKRVSFLHGGGIWTQDDVLPTEPFTLDV